jgi:hypothetical protein
MLYPTVCIGGKIGIFRKDVGGTDIFMQLNEKALLTDKHVEWIEGFHLVQLVFADIAFAKGMHPKVHKGSS